MDEEGGEGAAGLDRWLEELDRCYAGTPETELGRELAETVGPLPDPALRARGHRGRLSHGPHRAPLRDVRRPPRLLRARGLGGGPRLDRDLRVHEPAHPRVRGRAGARPAAHQHPARRGDRRRPGTGSTFRSRTWRGSGWGRRSSSPPRATRRPAAGRGRDAPGVRGRPGSRALRGRGRAAAPGGPALDARRRDHGLDLPGDPRGARPGVATRSEENGSGSARPARPGSRSARRRGCTGDHEGRRRRGRLRGPGRGHRAPGAASRRRAARAAGRPRRTGHLVPRRGDRRGRRQRNPPDGRGVHGDARPRPPGGRRPTCSLPRRT